MPGAGGLELQEALLGSSEPLPVIFLTGQGDVRSSVLAMKRGAVDFLAKPVAGDELVEAVTRAIGADATARAERKRIGALRTLYESLTPRERQVLQLVVLGRSSREIAGLLGTTERTIKAHRANLMEKMQVDSVAALVKATAWLDAEA
jgi:FixJ family two-component response regulator